MVGGRWNSARLPRTLQEAKDWARLQGLLPATDAKFCPVHRHVQMKYYDNSGRDMAFGRFRCPKKTCNKTMSGAVGTFFEECRLPLQVVIRLMYSFSRDWSYDDARFESEQVEEDGSVSTHLSSSTIAAWYRYCRDMVVDHFQTMQENVGPIGGPGVIVQIDESLFGHRKYNRGRVLEGHWVLGMIDSATEEVRMVIVERRDAPTLLGEIKKYVLPGSVIHTDSWRAYDGLEEIPGMNYVHRKVNHSDPEHRFVAEDGTHTQQIEATWRPAKDFFRGRSRFGDHEFAERLVLYLWRRYCRKNDIAPFDALLDAIKQSYIV